MKKYLLTNSRNRSSRVSKLAGMMFKFKLFKFILLKSLKCGQDFEVLFVSLLFGTLERLYYQFCELLKFPHNPVCFQHNRRIFRIFPRKFPHILLFFPAPCQMACIFLLHCLAYSSWWHLNQLWTPRWRCSGLMVSALVSM